jgi:preprotein translocase SecE subunit
MADKQKPRVRKIETVRERNEKAVLKAQSDASKVKKQPVRSVARTIGKPIGAAAKPFRVKPVRFATKWIGLILFPRYFRNAFKELRQVTWPNFRQTWKLTFSVLIFAIIFGTLVTLTDYGLDKVIKRIVLR